MSTIPSNPPRESARHLLAALLFGGLLLPLALPAFALSSDRDQPLDVRAQYNKSTFGGNNVTEFQGNVRMVQGSLKAFGDAAKIWEIDTANADSTARRLVLTGNPARLEQMMDNDGGKMTASAGTIDYRSDTGLAELTGNVIVVQEGRSEFRGPHMTYNTNTGAMEGGSQAPGSEVHMTFKPKPRSTTKPETDAKP
ncbi:MAG TPA: lipopolysaccharide transport periplasmic protein LptA [Dokdonella sp.]|jgi:lipopolysaccharide export system protein LptA|nr:lipopolysaccharide transport periplasmic protein LptA [Dokdonella sp.]